MKDTIYEVISKVVANIIGIIIGVGIMVFVVFVFTTCCPLPHANAYGLHLAHLLEDQVENPILIFEIPKTEKETFSSTQEITKYFEKESNKTLFDISKCEYKIDWGYNQETNSYILAITLLDKKCLEVL